jgi:hypothetical protein
MRIYDRGVAVVINIRVHCNGSSGLESADTAMIGNDHIARFMKPAYQDKRPRLVGACSL